ncbi:hypothetical protein BAAA27672_05895 [Bifidobacterium animalis subsp. animalis ATCC 27672]|nr:hypothetical protein BAAA27672_05895 [Bifidobacterium animalis subsp. animalis ATCC 27672]
MLLHLDPLPITSEPFDKMIPTYILIIRQRRVIRRIHINQIRMSWLKFQSIPTVRNIILMIIKNGGIDRLDSLKELLKKTLLQILASIIVTVAGIGENTTWTFFNTSTNKSRHGNCPTIRIFNGFNSRSQHIDLMIFLIRVIKILESGSNKTVCFAILQKVLSIF